MKVIFYHNVPFKLRRLLPGHSIQIANEMGWSSLANGVLLNASERAGFQVMITCDQGIFYQQNMKGRGLSLVVLTSNYVPSFVEAAGEILAAVDAAHPGSFQIVSLAPRFIKKPRPS